MRRAARVDRNQAEIVAVLRSVGASVQPLHTIGKGCPDLLVGHRGRNWLIEIKDGLLPPSKRQLTGDEMEWHAAWRGQVAIVSNAEEALALIGVKL
jgi:hypothetical protein